MERFPTNNRFSWISLFILFPCIVHAQNQIQDRISYTHDIRPLVKNFCTTCHAGDDPEGDLVLTSYKEVRHYTEKGKLLKRINDPKKPMPEDGLMPKYMRRLFQLWAEQGFLEKGKGNALPQAREYADFKPPKIKPVDINRKGFDLLEKMQGHWVGSMHLMGRDYDWMAFDNRAIAPSHVHGIYEAGTAGNLFTSFFVTNFNGTRTIMARNGGILNGIYRTSFFVLDYAQSKGRTSSYRLVDAYGGADIMYMEIVFQGEWMEFSSHTSRFGLHHPPKLHMKFTAKRRPTQLVAQAAKTHGFPKNIPDMDFSSGLPKPDWGKEYPLTSASYITEDKGLGLHQLARISKDPYPASKMPYLSTLEVDVRRTPQTRGKKLHIYLSEKALMDKRGKFITRSGYIRDDLLDTLLAFPEISAKQDKFTFTYLHPGKYDLTVVADMDGDGFPSPGDITHPLKEIVIRPKQHHHVTVPGLDARN